MAHNQPYHTEDMRKLSVSEHRCLHCIIGIWRENFFGHLGIVFRMLSYKPQSLKQVVNLSRPSWLGYVVFVPTDKLPVLTVLRDR